MKAGLVVQGFTQIEGQDFTHTFAPVAKWTSARAILAVSAPNDHELRHIDAKTAFLNGPLDEEICLRKPHGTGAGFWRLSRSKRPDSGTSPLTLRSETSDTSDHKQTGLHTSDVNAISSSDLRSVWRRSSETGHKKQGTW